MRADDIVFQSLTIFILKTTYKERHEHTFVWIAHKSHSGRAHTLGRDDTLFVFQTSDTRRQMRKHPTVGLVSLYVKKSEHKCWSLVIV